MITKQTEAEILALHAAQIAVFERISDEWAESLVVDLQREAEQVAAGYDGQEFNGDEDSPLIGLLLFLAPIAFPAYDAIYRRTLRETAAAIGESTGIRVPVSSHLERVILEEGGTRRGLLDLDDDARRSLFRALSEAREAELGLEQTRERITDRVAAGRYRTVETRASVIARTEVKHAQNVAAIEIYGASGRVNRIRIVDGLSGDTDEPCMEINGRIVTVEEARLIPTLAHPNCTRGFIPLVEPEARGSIEVAEKYTVGGNQMGEAVKALALDDLKIDGDGGTFSARFATLNVKDHDGDVITTGAIGKQDVKISQYNHGSWGEGADALPIGVGKVYEYGGQARVKGEFNLDNPAAAATYQTMKWLHSKGHSQEFSFALPDVDVEMRELDGEVLRHITRVSIPEVSPVMMGAGIDTALLSIKGRGMRLAEHIEATLEGIDALIARLGDVAEKRHADNKPSGISDTHMARVELLQAKLAELVDVPTGDTEDDLPPNVLDAAFLTLTNIQARKREHG